MKSCCLCTPIGCPGAAAAKILSTQDCNADTTGGIVGPVFTAAFSHHQGNHVFNSLGRKWSNMSTQHHEDACQQLAPCTFHLVADLLTKSMHESYSYIWAHCVPSSKWIVMYGSVPEYLASQCDM